MAKKKDNTIVWLAVLGIGGYLYYQYKQSQNPAASAPSNTAANASTGTLALPPSPVVNTNAGSSTVPAASLPVSNAPSSLALNTAGLVPANQLQSKNIALAIAPNGLPITDSTGMPLAFAPINVPTNPVVRQTYLANMSGNIQMIAGDECL